MDFEEKNTLFKIRKTVIEMVEDRKYIVPDSDKINFEEFSAQFDAKNLDIFIPNENKSPIYIHFHNENKSLAKSDLKNLVESLIEKYNNHEIKIIILLKEKGNGSIFKELKKEEYKHVEIFMNKNMIFNITHHQMVPKHSLLSSEEEEEILEKYNTTKNKLPKILRSDPIVQYYGMKPDQICKIIRKSPEVGESVYYRLVK
jgi:DNA-directed RNA polymerases I, II, and III subunit RPABC1